MTSSTINNEDDNIETLKVTKKFREYKLYDFNVYDGYNKDSDFDKSNFDPYKDNKNFIIQIFGINSKGNTACIFVEGFKPFFYINVDNNWNESIKTEFISHLRKKLGNYYGDSIVESKLISSHKLYGFDNHKLHKFIRISFANTAAFNKAKKLFYKDTYTNGQFNRTLLKEGYVYKDSNCYLYEANIPPLLKLFHIQKISPSGWVVLPKYKIITNKTTHCSFEYLVNYKDIRSSSKEKIVKYNICSFDIEASSSHGDFPVPIKNYKKLATDILEYYNNLNADEKDTYSKELLGKQIRAAYGYENLNYINKVYPKVNKVTEEQLSENFSNLINYIPLNDKKKKKDETIDIASADSDSEPELDDDKSKEAGDNEVVAPTYRRTKRVKSYNKGVNILEIIKDDKCEHETKLVELTNSLSKFYPALQGDIVTFIGLSFINYSEKKPYKRILIVKGGCKIPDKYEKWYRDNNVEIIEKTSEKGVLMEFTKSIKIENPHIITGYNIMGFDFEFMFKRSKEIGCTNEFLKLSRNINEVCINKDWRTGEEDIDTNKIILASGEYNLKFIKMPGRIIIDMCIVFRREYTLSSNKLDYTSSYFISDIVKKCEINKEKNTTLIYSKNLTGLSTGSFVKFEEISYSVNNYKKGKKFEVIDIDLSNSTFVIDSAEDLDLEKFKINWGLAKDDVTPQEIFKLSNGSDYDRFVVGKYCLADCDNVIWLLLKIDVITDKVEMSNLCDVPLSFLLQRGQGIKLTSYVSKKCGEKNTLMPVIEKELDDDGYEGAHVFTPKTGLYLEDPVACVDYSSLYPSSIISENLSHDSKVWTMEYNLSDELIKSTGIQDDKGNYIYDNLESEGYKYVDIRYDTYKYVRKTEKAAAKKVVTGYKICRFAQFPKGLAIMPAILEELLAARKSTRKLIPLQTDEFMKNILDKRQLSIKVTANSLYGQMGAKTSTFYEKDVAAATTATGRKLLFYGRAVIEGCYNNIEVKVGDGQVVKTKAECVYGDSVMGYTPIYIKNNDKIEALTVEELGEKYGVGWFNCVDEGKEDKLYCNLKYNIETWTNNGWTKLERIIKHKLHSSKNIVRVLTHTGLVDVTDEHSLLRDDETIISPKNIEIGTKLLHKTLILDNNESKSEISIEEAKIMGFFFGDGSCGYYDCPSGKKASWALNNSSGELFTKYLNLCEKVYPTFEWKVYNTLKSSGVNKLCFNCNKYGEKRRFIENYRNKMYYKNSKIIPEIILNSTREIREAFWEGLYDADGDKKSGNIRIDQKNQLSASHICLLANSLDYKTSINTRSDKMNVYRINCTKSHQRKNCDAIKKIINITDSLNKNEIYVYDLTTENHHFAAGIGNMIVHNTDSVFFKFNLRNLDGKRIINKQALIYTIELAKEAGELATKFLKKPHDLEYEKTFWPFNLLSKKRYDGMLYEEDPEKCKLKSMGNVLKRRDNAPIVKDIYGGVVGILMKNKSLTKSIDFVKSCLNDMIEEKYPIEKLLVTKSLRGYYKNPKQIAHKVLAERIGLRDSGNKPGSGDRMNYAYIKIDNKKALQGEKIETPEFIKENNLKLDYGHYISNQIMKPLLQLFALELENINEFRDKQFSLKEYGDKKSLTWEEEIQKLKDKWPEKEKYDKKYEELRCKEVKLLIFDKYLKDLK